MNEKEKSILISKYEKIKGYSSNLFDNEEWAEFDAFCIRYNLVKLELLENNTSQLNSNRVMVLEKTIDEQGPHYRLTLIIDKKGRLQIINTKDQGDPKEYVDCDTEIFREIVLRPLSSKDKELKDLVDNLTTINPVADPEDIYYTVNEIVEMVNNLIVIVEKIAMPTGILKSE